MTKPLFILILILVAMTILTGVNFIQRTFNIGAGIQVPMQVLDLMGLAPEEDSVSNASSSGLAVQVTSNSANSDESLKDITTGQKDSELSEKKSFQPGSIMAIPYLVGENASMSAERLDQIQKLQPAVVVLNGKGISQASASASTSLIRSIAPNALIGIEHEGGQFQPLSGKGFTRLPRWDAMCKLPDDQFRSLIASSAAELKTVGITIVLAPVLDLKAGGYIQERACSSDPMVVSEKAKKLVEIYRTAGIEPVVKHFPGLGSVNSDLRSRSDVVRVTDNDVVPFGSLLQSFPDLAVTVSFARVSDVDPSKPCALSQNCITRFKKATPAALIFTDSLDKKSAGYVASSSAELLPLPKRAVAAALAGNDVLVFGSTARVDEIFAASTALEEAYANDSYIRANIEIAKKRIEDWKEARSSAGR